MTLIGSEGDCFYRGRQYVQRAAGTGPNPVGDYYLLVRMDGDSEDDYPDALEFIDVFNGRLVKLPRKAIWGDMLFVDIDQIGRM